MSKSTQTFAWQKKKSHIEQRGGGGQDTAVRVNGELAINKPPIHLLLVPNCSSWLSNRRRCHLSLKPAFYTIDNVLPLDDFGRLSAAARHGRLTALRSCLLYIHNTSPPTTSSNILHRQSYLAKCISHFPRVSYSQSEMYCVLSRGKRKSLQSHSLWIDIFFSNVFSSNGSNNSTCLQ